MTRDELEAVLALPLPVTSDDIGVEGFFNPWEQVIKGIYGGYAGASDDYMIATLEAVRDGKTFELIEEKGFIIEFMLHVLAGHRLTEYGSSPRGAWPRHRDLWQPLIDKWKSFQEITH